LSQPTPNYFLAQHAAVSNLSPILSENKSSDVQMSSDGYPSIPRCLLGLFTGLWLLASDPSFAEKPSSSNTAFVICDSYCGVVDANGKLLSKRVYESAEIIDGLVLYKRGNNYGVADFAGHTLIKPSPGYLHHGVFKSARRGRCTKNNGTH
jgi:hypothetical protein